MSALDLEAAKPWLGAVGTPDRGAQGTLRKRSARGPPGLVKPRRLAKAWSDLLTIANCVTAEETPWDVVAFHAQQAGEKALKAFMVAHGVLPPKIHDCVRLLEECASWDPNLLALRPACASLVGYAIFSRYPQEPWDIPEAKALGLADGARQVVAAVVPALGVPFDDPLGRAGPGRSA